MIPHIQTSLKLPEGVKATPAELSEGRKLAKEMYGYNKKLREIEAKEKCLRVQFLDWLSDKLLDWSNRIHVMASKIDSPCVIEVAPRKKEDSKHAKDSKEIARLRQLLKEEREKNKK